MRATPETPSMPRAVERPSGTVPIRQLVGMFRRYPDALEAVDRLRRAGITSDGVTVVGQELAWMRAADPARAVGRVASASGLLGAMIGFLTWLVGLGDTGAGAFVLAAFAAVVGVVAGVLTLALWYVLTRDDASVPETGRVEAGRYDVLVDEAHAAQADEILRSQG